MYIKKLSEKSPISSVVLVVMCPVAVECAMDESPGSYYDLVLWVLVGACVLVCPSVGACATHHQAPSTPLTLSLSSFQSYRSYISSHILDTLEALMDHFKSISSTGRAKAKPPSNQQSGQKATFFIAKSPAFAGVQMTLNVFKEVASATPVPGLEQGVKALVIVLDALQVSYLLIVAACFVLIGRCRKRLKMRMTSNRS